jgi:thioredoxin reductase (NADPH)
MLVRGHEPTASKYLVDAMEENEKIEILTDTDLLDVIGTNSLEQIIIRHGKDDEPQTLEAAALFVFIGVRPQSQIVADVVKRSDKAYIYTGPDVMVDRKPPPGWTLERDPLLLETSTPGIFAAGDVRYGTTHRVASAVGEGAIAYALMKEYLKGL